MTSLVNAYKHCANELGQFVETLLLDFSIVQGGGVIPNRPLAKAAWCEQGPW